MKETHVLSFALSDAAGRFVFVKRLPDREEFANYWSLPTKSVSRDVFAQAIACPETAVEVLQDALSCRVDDSVYCVSLEHRDRPDYALEMALCSATISGVLGYDRQKYAALCWCPPGDIIDLFPDGGGTCVSMLVRMLISAGRLSGACPFVEVTPDFAADPPPDNVKAWSNWAYDQYVSLSRGGGLEGGYAAKRLTVDRYFSRRARSLRSAYASALDAGCGNGDLVRELKAFGYDAIGVDISLSETLRGGGEAVEGNLESSDFDMGRKFDLILANLILPWVANLDTFIKNVRKCLKDRGRLIVSILPPDYAKNGDWMEVDGRRCWLVTRPVRRQPQLAMINHTVGPLYYYPRSILDYINAFAGQGLYADRGSYLFLDSEVTEAESAMASPSPMLERHRDYPLFAVIEFVGE